MSIGVLIVDEFPVSLHYWRRIEILPPWNDGLEFLWISNKGDYARFHHLLKQGGEQIPVDIVLLNVEFGTCRSKIAPDPRDRCSVFDLLQNQRRFDSDSVLFGIDADRIGKELRLVWGDSAVIVPFSRQIDVETADVWPVADADCPVLSIPPGSARDEFSILMRYGLETMRDRIVSSRSWDVEARVVLKSSRRTFEVPLAAFLGGLDQWVPVELAAEMNRLLIKPDPSLPARGYSETQIDKAKEFAELYSRYRFEYPGRQRADLWDLMERCDFDGSRDDDGNPIVGRGELSEGELERLRNLVKTFDVQEGAIGPKATKKLIRAMWTQVEDAGTLRLAVLLLFVRVYILMKHGPPKITRILHYLDARYGRVERNDLLHSLNMTDALLDGYLHNSFWIAQDRGQIERTKESRIAVDDLVLHRSLDPSPHYVNLGSNKDKTRTMQAGLRNTGLNLRQLVAKPLSVCRPEIKILQQYAVSLTGYMNEQCWPVWLRT